ncbi:MAG: DNA alkylation repair protein [Euryarchaeota archaeon]|nr:DNA alkylation repair protein [Euryarchaeota archaeon]MDE1836035.1 DNA alkylation repair protein [Euryarchaeota archaeon]MDE1881233.1 DNA alkylation repair protein [Euryarchaeota archaeon]MDE2044013.1 DNA alkylation repair protein [Thermoplasmata archaeon]
MQAYMRSRMPFHGVHAEETRRRAREVFSGVQFTTPAEWRATLVALWDGARFREERYAVVTLARSYVSDPFQTPRALPVFEHLIVTGAWWDLVDEIAIKCVGPLLLQHPREVAGVMREWSLSSDLWKRRTAIICQVGAKERTDVALLADCIGPSIRSKEFFLRKAIGWSLRQYARTDPSWVRRFVAGHPTMSPLSRREALRHL